MMETGKCKHGMLKKTCHLCRQAPAQEKAGKKKGERREKPTQGTGRSGKTRDDFVVIYPQKNHSSHSKLDSTVTKVHIAGRLESWLLNLIIERAPGVKVIQVIPKLERRLTKEQKDISGEHGIKLVAGHVRPQSEWSDDRRSSAANRKFLLNLVGLQKALFEELLDFGIEAAKLTARYFCLAGEDYMSMRVLGEEVGVTFESVNTAINAVLRYLNPEFETSLAAKKRASSMRERVVGLRKVAASQEEMQKILQELGIVKFPEGLPLGQLDLYKALLDARNEGRLEELRLKEWRSYMVVVVNFGMDDDQNPQYRTSEQVAEFIPRLASYGAGKEKGEDESLSEERIRQLKNKAFRILGIDTAVLE